jgi:Tol biopolymer transport system component
LPLGQPEHLPARAAELLARAGADLNAVPQFQSDADGQWLLFETTQSILPEDGNGVSDIYRLDLMGETLNLVSRTPAGAAGNGPSRYPAADASGELVVFQSEAGDLVAGDTNGTSDIFLHDVAFGETMRITLTDGGVAAHPALDAAGEVLLYDRRDADGHREILLDRLLGGHEPEYLSLARDGAGLPLDNHHPAISADGRYVAYMEHSATVGAPSCDVHFYDRDTEAYARRACPEALADASEEVRPAFRADGHVLDWYLPQMAEPISLSNPLSTLRP